MTPAHLAALHQRAFADSRGWSPDEFASLLAQTGVHMIGDKRSFILLRIVLEEAEILTLATDPAHRRQGLAAQTLRAAERKAAQRGTGSLFLEVAENNAPALALYQKAGFQQVGERHDYYKSSSGQAVAALILRKAI